MLYTYAIDRRLLLRAAVGAAIFIPHPSHSQRAEPVGSVEEVKGEAFAEARAERRTLGRAAPLFINDLVGTGADSRLTLQLGKDTTLRVGQQARLTIDRFLVNAGGEITLRSGAILFDRPAGSPPARMQIRSSFGLIAVRGTRFFAGPSAGVFGVFVERGRVTVSAAGVRVSLRKAKEPTSRVPAPPLLPLPLGNPSASAVRSKV